MWVESEGTAKSDFSFLAFHPCRYLQIADFWVRAANSPFVLRCVNSCTVRRKSVFLHFHLGHNTNTVAANYGSGYALEVMREHMEKVW
jgi:hypothetical protein